MVSSGAPELDGDLAVAEEALAALNEAWEAAVYEPVSAVSPAQLRAVLAIAKTPLSLTALARRLRASASATSRLCDRLQQAGLVARRHAAPDRRAVLLSLTPAGARLAAWVREQRRARLAETLEGMVPARRRALIDGLRGLSAATRGDLPDTQAGTVWAGDVPSTRMDAAAAGSEPAARSEAVVGEAAVGSDAAAGEEATVNRWARDPAGLFASIDGSVGRSLCALTRAVTDHVADCYGASATLWEPDEVVAMGASNADLAAVAEHQFLTGDGPIIAALRTGEPAVTPDTLSEHRWPEFAVAALAAGVRSQVTVVREYSLMTLSLSLYATTPGAFDEYQSPAELLAGFGIAAMAGAAEEGRVRRTPEQLDAAIRSRAEVEEARELVMRKLACGPDEAFERLWRIAQQQRRRVAEVARRMVMASETPQDARAATS